MKRAPKSTDTAIRAPLTILASVNMDNTQEMQNNIRDIIIILAEIQLPYFGWLPFFTLLISITATAHG
jgi:hypothetical protein